jgi:Glutamate synthase domain 2
MILLGANRVGFGTLAMVAIGCTICRKCEEGTCLMGITTQIRTSEEAREKGLKVFNPLEYESAVARLVRLFNGMEEEVRQILRNAAKEENRPVPKLGSRIAARFRKTGLTTDLPELHGQLPRSAEFGK